MNYYLCVFEIESIFLSLFWVYSWDITPWASCASPWSIRPSVLFWGQAPQRSIDYLSYHFPLAIIWRQYPELNAFLFFQAAIQTLAHSLALHVWWIQPILPKNQAASPRAYSGKICCFHFCNTKPGWSAPVSDICSEIFWKEGMLSSLR